jgi:hypothetical protein
MTIIKRLKKDDPQSYIVMIIYKEAVKHPKDGQWREYRGQVEQAGNKFDITAKFVIRGEIFSYKDLEVKPSERKKLIIH